MIDLFYFDASGFSLTPEVPYGWQSSEDSILQPSALSKRINVLGFLNTNNDLTPYVFEETVNSAVVVACFDDFAKSITKTTVVVLDNAPVHTSGFFLDQTQKWENMGLFLYNIPPYSPELNKIEILWKMIKYYWIPFEAYISFSNLQKAIDHVLVNVGKKYHITFA